LVIADCVPDVGFRMETRRTFKRQNPDIVDSNWIQGKGERWGEEDLGNEKEATTGAKGNPLI